MAIPDGIVKLSITMFTSLKMKNPRPWGPGACC
jgi:hypothetical protein